MELQEFREGKGEHVHLSAPFTFSWHYSDTPDSRSHGFESEVSFTALFVDILPTFVLWFVGDLANPAEVYRSFPGASRINSNPFGSCESL